MGEGKQEKWGRVRGREGRGEEEKERKRWLTITKVFWDRKNESQNLLL